MCALPCAKSHTLLWSSHQKIPREALGVIFALDVLRPTRQMILVVRENVSSHTSACLVETERHETLRTALIRLCIELRPLAGPLAVIRTDCSQGFAKLVNDELLQRHIEFALN